MLYNRMNTTDRGDIMSLSEKERLVLDAIDRNSTKIIEIGKKVLEKPELGYKEFETASLVKNCFDELGLDSKDGIAYTGVKATLGKNDGFNVCIIGELDSIVCSEHPNANTENHAAHACGHNVQIANMLGAAIGLTQGGIIDNLGGKITFMATPAEEYIELDYRKSLKDEGKIKYYGGKQQLIYEGEFDDVDAAIMVHARPEAPEKLVCLDANSVGFVMKSITFHGKSVHAAKPYDGVNALNAAALAILGIHTCRERFREEDNIKVHFIVTSGGDVVNVVPDKVTLECQVRANNTPAMMKASEDVDAAIKGAAMMVGAEVDIETIVGYQPFNQSEELGKVFDSVSEEFMDKEAIRHDINMTGSSDIGDVSYLLPTIQPMVGGFTGQLHAKEFCVSDDYTAYVLPAKLMALTAVRLLENDAKLGKEIKKNFKPLMTKEEYIKLLEG